MIGVHGAVIPLSAVAVATNASRQLVAASVQGSGDTKVMLAGTVSGLAATLCTDANGGATTTGCSAGGGGNTTSTSLTTNTLPKANGANSIINSNETDDGTTFATTLPFQAPSMSTSGSGAGADGFGGGTQSLAIFTNQVGWMGPATTPSGNHFFAVPLVGAAANQFMLYGAESAVTNGFVSTPILTTFISTSLTDTANLLYTNATRTVGSGTTLNFASGAILDLHLATTAGLLFPGGLSTGVVRVTTSTGAVTSAEMSGDCLTSGSNALTCTKTSGTLFGTAATVNTGTSGATLGLLNGNLTFGGTNAYGTPTSITLTNGTGLPPAGVTAAQGNGTKFQFSTGATTTNDCVKFDANGNTVDAGSACGSSGGSGGGVSGWSGLPLTFVSTATQYAPPVGGALTSATESAVQLKASAAATITGLQVSITAQLGASATLSVTLRDAGVSTALTCTTASGGTTCTDTTHSVNVAQGDLLSFLLVSSGTVTAGLPQVEISFAVGTSGVGVTAVTGSAGVASSGGTTPNITLASQSGDTVLMNATGSSAAPNGCCDAHLYDRSGPLQYDDACVDLRNYGRRQQSHDYWSRMVCPLRSLRLLFIPAWHTAHNVMAFQFVPAVGITVNTIAYPNGANVASAFAAICIYPDSSGSPGTLLGQTTPFSVTAAASTGIFGAMVSPVTLAAGTPYWIGVTADTTAWHGWDQERERYIFGISLVILASFLRKGAVGIHLPELGLD